MQVTALHANLLCGLRDVATAVFQLTAEIIVLKLPPRFFKAELAPIGQANRPGSGTRLARLEKEAHVLCCNQLARGHDYQAFDYVAQLTDITRPTVPHEQRKRAVVYVLLPQAPTAELAEKLCGQQGDIFLALL